jgi:hypothetical protein
VRRLPRVQRPSRRAGGVAVTTLAHLAPNFRRIIRTTERCAQCWREKPFPRAFIGARGAPVKRCRDCQEKYRAWDKLTLDERAALARKEVLGEKPVGGHRVTFAPRSGNKKTGPIPVSITDTSSCPTTCAFQGAGCYAAYGMLGGHWRATARRGLSWSEFCARVAALPPGTLWRHNEAGDLPSGKTRDAIDARALRQLVAANRGRRGFSFSHYPMDHAANRRAVAAANADGFTINLSADSLEEADELAALRIAPVAVVLPADVPARATRTPAGRKVVVCPAQTSGLTCETCQLCAVPRRKAIVGFRAHGQFRALVSDLVQLGRGAS